MSVARVTEIISASPTSFEHAVQSGIERAAKTIHGIQGAWVKEQWTKLINFITKLYPIFS